MHTSEQLAAGAQCEQPDCHLQAEITRVILADIQRRGPISTAVEKLLRQRVPERQSLGANRSL